MKPKRRRRARSESSASARTSLSSLPIEILAEILLNTCSPPTVLAVSRTSSFFYHSLARNPAASFIWRGVRKTCSPRPLPDPCQYWKKSEADYAAFVFGGGVCEVCRMATRNTYTSFAARIRLCSNWHCRKKLLGDLVDVSQGLLDRRLLWIPYVESDRCFHPSVPFASTWPGNDSVLLRATDLDRFREEFLAYQVAEKAQAGPEATAAPGSLSVAVQEENERTERFMEHCHAAMERFPAIMEFSARLICWKRDYDREYKIVKNENQTWTTDLAQRKGWNLDDLVASQTYGSLQKRKNFLLERIQSNDVSPIWSTIESELLAVQARRQRQEAETSYKARSTEVEKIYERMRCGTLDDIQKLDADLKDSTGALILPSLSVFCTLPCVRALKGSPNPNAVSRGATITASNMKSSPLATWLIMSDIQVWLDPVQKHLMNLLGYPNGWQSASTRMLPPLKRVTARFFCQRCGEGEVGRSYQREGCLDLRGVCSHVCVARGRKSTEGRIREVPQEGETGVTDDRVGNGQERGIRSKKNNGNWTVDVFRKDEKAIRLIKTILNLTGLSEEDPFAASSLKAKGDVIRCMTCKGWIVMDFDTAIGHAHRHESMQVKLLTMWDSFPSSRMAFERGLSESLLGRTYRARKICQKANYGCKHCLVAQRDAIGVEVPDVGVSNKAMNFNGLRSHVKEKHGIQDIGDEDIFCIKNKGEEIRE